MKKFSLFIAITILCHCGIEGKPLWTSIDKVCEETCVTITTIESNENGYKAKIEIHGYYDEPKTIEGTTYHCLSFDEPGSLSFVGEPAFPLISRLIALPKGENFEVRIREEKWSEEFFVGQVMPSQRSVFETEKEPPFEKNTAIYEGEEYLMKRIYVGSLQKWRGINNRSLNICPFRYMPKEGRMSVLKEFVLDISFEEAATSCSLKTDDMHLFFNQINIPERDMTPLYGDSTERYEYLIIAGNIPGVLESQALADFRKWKAFKGLKTKVVSTKAIGDTEGEIKQYISSEYSKGIKYVLFVGDCDEIPLYYYQRDTTNYAYSDYWYGCLDDSLDVQADISIGRFSTSNLSDLANMVNKTISYEGNARNYGGEVLLVAHQDSTPVNYAGCSEAIRTYHYYCEPVSFTTAYGGSGATNADVIREINKGKNIINYRGHGLSDRWRTWSNCMDSFKAFHIDSLDNSTNDIYFCIACWNGDIIEESCFMETFMCSNHGAAGMIASTLPSYSVENSYYDQNLFIKLFKEHIYNIGDLNVAAHIATITTTDSIEHTRAIINAFRYLCGCDPSLEIITANTKNFENYTLSFDGQNLIIDCGSISGYKACVVNADGMLSSAFNSSGSSCSFPAPTENFYLVFNKHNYVPRIIYVNVTDNNIQNKVFNNIGVENYYVKDATIKAGYDVTTAVPYGNVIVENGSKLSISKKNGVIIKNGFKCELGGELKIK